jgi:hypothetical protein
MHPWLTETVHVSATGEVTYGAPVPDVGDSRRLWASQPKRVHGMQFRGTAGVPKDTWVPDKRSPSGWRRTAILKVTRPHDCANHLTGVE